MRKSVVLGYPISLAVRGGKALQTLLGGSAGTIGTKTIIGSTILGGGVAALGSSLLSTTPWLTSQLDAASNTAISSIEGITPASAGLDFLGGLLTFVDLNASEVTLVEKRRMAVVNIPGRESDFLQDLGGHTTRYEITGRFFESDPRHLTYKGIMQTVMKVFIDNAAVSNTQMLRTIMRYKAPVPFMYEYDIAMVIITDFKILAKGGDPMWVDYKMTLMEYQRIPFIAKMGILSASDIISR